MGISSGELEGLEWKKRGHKFVQKAHFTKFWLAVSKCLRSPRSTCKTETENHSH